MKRKFLLFAMLVTLDVAGGDDEGRSTSLMAVLPGEPKQPWLLHSPPERLYDDVDVIALCEAVRRQRILEVELLLKQGVDLNAIGKQGVRPIIWCLPICNDCLELLVRNGADLDFRYSGPFSGNPIHREETPLAAAALYFDGKNFALTLDHATIRILRHPGMVRVHSVGQSKQRRKILPLRFDC